jgi:thioredoxin 1
MVRSRLTVAGLVVVVLAVLVVKAARSPHAAARVETAPPPAAAADRGAPAAKTTRSDVLTGADLAACLKSGKPTLVDFGEDWCEQCKKQAPVLEETATKYRGRANVVFVNTKTYAEIGRAYGIAAIPTQILFDAKGREVSRHVGYAPPEDLAKALAKVGAT